MTARNPDSSSELGGSLLLAHPSLRDENFKHTVILIASHDSEGAMGVVLNRPLDRCLGELNTEFGLSGLAQVPLFAGGPVQTTQVILCVWRPNPESDGFQLMFGIDPQRAEELVNEEGVHMRAFLGYAGWTAGQVEEELERDTWVVSPLVADLLEDSPDEQLWRDLLAQIDDEWKLLADEPDDPSVN
jgi:putative transcriptional regulator